MKYTPDRATSTPTYSQTTLRVAIKPVFTPPSVFKPTNMASAESPDPNTDLVPVAAEGEEVDPVAPAQDPKLPTRKDASLKEFLSKMDDYAPIVRAFNPSGILHLIPLPDSRCCDELLSYQSWTSAAPSNR
jgi:hypothetical protein